MEKIIIIANQLIKYLMKYKLLKILFFVLKKKLGIWPKDQLIQGSNPTVQQRGPLKLEQISLRTDPTQRIIT